VCELVDPFHRAGEYRLFTCEGGTINAQKAAPNAAGTDKKPFSVMEHLFPQSTQAIVWRHEHHTRRAIRIEGKESRGCIGAPFEVGNEFREVPVVAMIWSCNSAQTSEGRLACFVL
jgi:hypothetical protein